MAKGVSRLRFTKFCTKVYICTDRKFFNIIVSCNLFLAESNDKQAINSICTTRSYITKVFNLSICKTSNRSDCSLKRVDQFQIRFESRLDSRTTNSVLSKVKSSGVLGHRANSLTRTRTIAVNTKSYNRLVTRIVGIWVYKLTGLINLKCKVLQQEIIRISRKCCRHFDTVTDYFTVHTMSSVNTLTFHSDSKIIVLTCSKTTYTSKVPDAITWVLILVCSNTTDFILLNSTRFNNSFVTNTKSIYFCSLARVRCTLYNLNSFYIGSSSTCWNEVTRFYSTIRVSREYTKLSICNVQRCSSSVHVPTYHNRLVRFAHQESFHRSLRTIRPIHNLTLV